MCILKQSEKNEGYTRKIIEEKSKKVKRKQLTEN